MFWSEEHLASHSRSRDSGVACPTTEEISRLNILNWLSAYAPASFVGKTSPAYYQAYHTTLPIHVNRRTTWRKGPNGWEKTNTTLTKVMRSPASWPDFQKSGMGGPTEFMTLNISAWHRGGSVCSLSEVLEAGPIHPRYFLSAKACAGILRRAERRGEGVAHPVAQSLGASGLGYERTGETREQNLVVAMALNAHGGSGRMDGESETFVASVAPALSKSNPYGDHESREGLLVASVYRTSGNCGAWDTGDRVDALNTGTDPSSHLVTHPLRAEGFDASEDGTGRGVPLVTVGFQSNAGGQNGEVYENLSPAIKAQATGGVGMPAIAFQDRFCGNEPWNVAESRVVRRLSPLECQRLQGFPDSFFDGILYLGKPLADGVKYRLLGNSMAVPVMRHIGEQIARTYHPRPNPRGGLVRGGDES